MSSGEAVTDMNVASMTPILVARPTLPDLARVTEALEGIWDRNMVTNFGPLEQKLARRIATHLGLDDVRMYSNGHLAIEAMLNTLPRKGEVITAPFTFPSTIHAIINAGHTPVLVDVEEGGFGPDPQAVEDVISDKTVAILGVHVYGTPCNVDAFDDIGARHDIAVLYDAAHCFGAMHRDRSLISFGDAAMVSTHATKIYHTIEGGFVSRNTDRLNAEALGRFRNFGIADGDVLPNASNAKMSELHAAIGLLNLDDFEGCQARRLKIAANYDADLKNGEGFAPIDPASPNMSYYVLRFEGPPEQASANRAAAMEKAQGLGVHSRPYFSPSLNRTTAFRPYTGNRSFARSEALAASLLCLPMFDSMGDEDQARVIAAFT